MLKPSKNNFRTYSFAILIVLFFINPIKSQEKNITFNIKKNPVGTNYWWLEKNNFGREISEFSLEGYFKFKKPKTSYVINLFSEFEKNNLEKISFNELFIKHALSDNTFFRVGRYYRDFTTYLNNELSSGSMLISHNAQAMPKLGLVTSYIIKKNEHISFDFGIAHAVFNKTNIYKESPLLHEKFLYMNIKKNNYIASIGLVHEAIWGGYIESDHKFAGNQPSSFSDFLKIFISADGPADIPHANALGNHLGIWDFLFQKNNNNKILKVYYQHLFEDTSGLRFANKTDGLWGLELTEYLPNTTILFEYLNTSNQFIDPPYVSEQYYNHFLYRSGWSYKDYTLGNPFIDHLNIKNIKILHIGVKGKMFENYNYGLKVSKDTNSDENIKYKLSLSKISKNQIQFFIVNNGSINRLGISLSQSL